jgi:hypothetical protein
MRSTDARFRVRPVCALISAMFLFAACAEPPTAGPIRIDPVGPQYSSVEDLAEASDAVAFVTIGKKLEVRQDGEPDVMGDEVPMAIFEVTVDKLLKGRTDSSAIQLAVLDEGASVETDWITAPLERERLVLFLERIEPPALQMTTPFYVVVGGDNGVLSVEGATLTARSNALRRLRTTDALIDGQETPLVLDVPSLEGILVAS